MKYRYIIFLFLISPLSAAVKPAMTSFNCGEVSPLMLMRSDFGKYDNSCKTLQNMLPLSQGPVTRRPGTYYIADATDPNVLGRLIPFEYAKTDAYVMEFGDNTIRFFRSVDGVGGQILTSEGTEDISDLDNIVAHWLLNDELDNTTVVDDDGATYNGVATANTDTLSVEGKVNDCFDFESTYAVEIADNANFSFDDSGAKPFSIIAWVYVDGTDVMQVIASKWKEDTAREWRLSIDDSQHLQMHLCDDSINLTSDYLAQWYLNDDAANTHVDDVSTNYDGVASANTDTFNATGKISGGLDFGGDKYVTVADAAGLSFGDASDDSAFSISAWIYVSDESGTRVILSKYDEGVAVEWRFLLTHAEKLFFSCYDDSAAAYIMAITDDGLIDGWHHVVCTYDATELNTGIILYVDSEAVGISRSSGGTYVAMEDTATNVLIGAGHTAGTEDDFYDGILDNVILFDIELTVANVSNLYNDGYGTESLAATFPSVVSDDALSVGWHLVSMTYDSTGGATAADGIVLYVDGSAVDSTATNEADYVAMEDTAIKVRIGSQYSAAAANEKIWNDKIDNVAIFSDVLTATEVASLYTTSTYEITTPYSEDELSGLQYVQIADTMYIVSGNESPYKLERTGHDDWTITDVNYVDGPFLDENETTTTITPSATTGTVTLTASANIFSAGHVGSVWRIRHPRTDATLSGSLDAAESSSAIDCEGDYKVTTHGTWTATVYLEKSLDGTNYEIVSGSLVSSVDDDNISYSGNEPDEGYEYRITMSDFTSGTATYNFVVYDHMHTGHAKVTSYVSPTEVTAEVHTELGGTTATTYFSEGYWSDKNGWPQTIEFHEFRLWYGGSRTYPQTLWASKTDDYEVMSEGTDDDDPLIYMLPSQNPIQWMLSQSYLMIGTLGGAGRLGDPDEAMTPTTQPRYYQQSKYGSASMQAIMAGDAILYIERGGKKVREFIYNLERDQFVAPDMTVLAEHITTDGIVDIAYQSRPDSTLWCVLEDGNTASLTYNREQDVVAWATHSTEGDFESVAVMPGDDEDEVWFLVNRIVDSNSARYIEQMQPRNWGSTQSECFFVDSGLTYNGGNAVYISDVDQSNPALVTVSSWPVDIDGNNITDGNQIEITGVTGMTELNDNVYTIDDSDVDALTFTLNNSADTSDVNSIAYTEYISGGTVQRVENSFTGFDHLEGETLKVLADGRLQTDVVVGSGAFTIGIWANKVHAGLSYTSILETMPIVFTTQEGSVAASNKRVSDVSINFYKSLGTKYGKEGDVDECFTESSLVTSWKNLSFQHGYTREATIYFEQEKPLPLCVRAIIPTVSVTE